MISYFPNPLIVQNFISANIKYLFPFSACLNAIIIIFIISLLTKLFLYSSQKEPFSKVVSHSVNCISLFFKKPMCVFAILYGLYLASIVIHFNYPKIVTPKILNTNAYIIEFFIVLWCLKNILTYGKNYLSAWMTKSNHPLMNVIFQMVSHSLEAIFYIIVINIILTYVAPEGLLKEISEKILRLLLIGTIGWIILKIIDGIEQLIINKNTSSENNIHDSRKIITQVTILKKVFYAVCLVVMISAMLMVFDSVRSIGAGLLTTAGIIGAAGAFASQRSVAGLFSGLHLAFTQPIRIGDTVVIDDQSGQVEEITLSYVVIKLWDLRRLILPTNYFTTKGILNLTRNSSELVGSIILYVDYTLKIDILRDKFNALLANSLLWDRKTSSLQVVELKEQSVQVRALVSAKNSSDLWNLRCEIREQLLQFISDHSPSILPKTRQMTL